MTALQREAAASQARLEERAAQLQREQEAREAAARELAEQAAREQAAREQATREQGARAQAAREQTERSAQQARASRSRSRSAPATPTAPAPAPFVAPPAGGGACEGRSLSGYANGLLPAGALCALTGTDGLLLRADAAAAFNRMAAVPGMPCAGNSYRSYGEQVSLYQVKPGLAAVPGTSNHGWGVAVDFACGADSFGSSAYAWLKANAPTYGWTHPAWAEPGGGRPEPWHWEFTG